jgi:YD repeat-containing protein
MVSIFTGNGLGVFQSSATQLGQGSGTRLGQGRESHGINVATGNLVLQALDEGLIVRGQSAAALRTYNSRGQVSGMGQDGWATGYERWVELDGELNTAGSAVRYHNGEGDQVVYAFDASRGMYVATAGSGAHDVIAWEESGWYRYRDGNWSDHEYFESNEYQQSGEFDPQPRALLRWVSHATSAYLIHYDALGRVSEVVSSVGYPNGDAIVYGYEGNTQRLASIATRENGVVRTQVTYGYDPAGRLSWVQTDLTPDNAADNAWDHANAAANDGRLFRTRYAYTSGDAADLRIAGVTASDGATVSYTYESDGAGGWRVKTVTEGSVADGSARTLTFVYGAGSTDVIDAAGRTWTYRYDANKQLIAVLAPAVDGQRQTTSYEYDAAGNVTRIATSSFATATGTGGASIEEQRFRYDGNGNRTQQRDLQGNVIAWTYNQANQVTSETRYTVADADGLDADQAGNGSMPSGAMTTRYVYENDWSDRLRFVINAEGEVRELTYESTAPYYDWMLASERRYLGERYTGTVYTDQALIAWASDAAAQRRANSSLTSYAYDAKGRLERSIEYATVTANAAGAGVLDTAATITRHVHDAQGLLRQSIVSRGVGRTTASALAGSEVTEYVYDGMGRLLSVLKRDAATAAGDDANTLRTIYGYVDSENRIRVTQDNGLVRIEARNRAGELLSVSETGAVAGASATRTSRNHYDDTGRLRASEDAAGGRSYFFHDTAGRLIATVDPTGAVSRTVYDSAGRIASTTRYATLSNTQGWLIGGVVTRRELVFAAAQPASLAADQVWVVQADDDRVAQMRYDSAGRLVRATDNAGSEVSYEYDGANRLVRTTEWGDDIYSGGWGSLVSARRPPAPSRETRTTRMFYDNADRLVATLDAEGYLSESVYDAGGRLAKTVRYSTRTNSAYWASGTLQQLRPTNATADQTTRLFHDARGRQIGQLDAEGYLTEMVYDEQNNQRATREYAKQLTGLSGTESLLALRTAAMANAPAEAQRETMNSYNGLGQLFVSRNHEGTVTRYIYDEAGQLLKTEIAADTSEIRAGGLRYDVFGHLIGEISGDGAALLQADMTEAQLDALYAQYGVRHRYDALGRRVESTDALGHKTWYFHDEAGRQRFVVRGVEDAAGLKNALGEVSEVRYTAFGDVADTLAYDGRIAIAVPGDRASAASALQQLTALAGTSHHTQFAYDRAGRLIRRQEVDGAASDFDYNRFGELRNAWRSSASGEWISSAAYTYDRRGQRIGTEEYDAYSWRNTSAVHDAFGRLVRAADARGTVSEFSYDRLGRQIGQLLRNVGGQDLSMQTRYDAFDRVVAQVDAMGCVTQYSHSDAARSMTMVTPEGVAITTVHNAFGQTIETRQPLPDGSIAIQRMTYDNRGLLTSATDALGHDTTHQYDARGQLIRTTDATGRSVAYAYDAVGRTLSRSEDPDGLNLTTRYVYDGQGRQLQTTDPSGRVSRMTYDRKGQLIELAQDPDGLNLRTTYTWDGEGNRLSATLGAGTAAAQTTAYEYDGFGRRISETIDPSGLALRTEYVYDANDNMIARSGYGGSARYAYDAANRLRFSIDAMSGVSETTYDANGRVVARRAYARALDLGAYGTASPDDAGMVALIDEQGLRDDARDVVNYVVYDRDGRVRLTINGAGEVTESVYDSAGRKVADKGYAQRLALTPVLRDALRAGALTAAEVLTQVPSSPQSDAVVRYFHDALGRLIYTVNSVGGMTRMWYDAAGRVEKVRTFAKPVAVASLATATIASLDAQLDWSAGFEGENRIHDGAGRLRYRISADGTLREFRYDAAGNVVVSLRYLQRAFEMTAPDILDPEASGGDANGDITPVSDLAAFTALHELEAAAEYSIYDSAGRLRLQMVKVTKNGSHLTSFTLATVEHQYDAAGRTIATHAYTQALSTGLNTNLRDRLQQGTATEADFDAQLAIRRATAQVIRMVYDAAGREVYRIDGANGVLGTTYSAIGQVASTRRYANALPSNTAPTAAVVAAQLAGSPQDLVEYQIHDAAGRLVFRVLGDRSVEEIRHDGMGRTTAMWRYGARIDSALMQQVEAGQADASGFAAFVAANESDARVQGLHYDQAGRVRYQTMRSAAGTAFVSETVHDAMGRETASVRYGVEIAWQAGADALAVQSAIDAALSVDPVQRAAQMRTTRAFHDGDGRQRFMLDASGALSEQRYDGAGRLTETIAYGNRPTATATADTASLEAWVQTQVSTDIRRSRNLYDNAGQVIARVDALGRSEYYEYDTAGNITAHTNRNGARWRYEYDKAGRRIAEISPQVSVTTASAGSGASTSVARAIATRYVYDGLRNIVARIEDADGPAPRTTRYEYDNRGHQIRTILPDPLTGGTAAGGSNDTIEVRYDTLGLAVSEKDALGNMQYRVYDNLGRVLYDIDAEQQVTSHRYNAFGEETRTVRHATALNAMAMQAAGWQPGQAPTDTQILAGLTVGAQDRGVETEYNALGQKTLVMQDAVSYVKRDGTAATGRPALLTAYNAYGEVAKTSLLIEGAPDQVDAVWAETHHYYDALGRETTTVDAEGYVNEQQYNAYGDIWRKTEYARGLSASARAGLGLTQPPAMPVAGDAATGFDRTMEYTFDALGRISTETIKRFVQTSSSNALQAVDVSTEFGYDAEGQVTLTRDALGETRTTYDALGRITAVRHRGRQRLRHPADQHGLRPVVGRPVCAAIAVHDDPVRCVRCRLADTSIRQWRAERQYAGRRQCTRPHHADALRRSWTRRRGTQSRGRNDHPSELRRGRSSGRGADAAPRRRRPSGSDQSGRIRYQHPFRLRQARTADRHRNGA